jgi:hypothetical protein
MLTDAIYHRALRAQEDALKLACKPEFKEQAMRVYAAVGKVIQAWDEQQIAHINRRSK